MRPHYNMRPFDRAYEDGLFHLLASGKKAKSAMQIEQDVNIYAGQADPRHYTQYFNKEGRQSYAYLLEGQMRVNGFILDCGDALKIRNKESLCFSVNVKSPLLIVEITFE